MADSPSTFHLLLQQVAEDVKEVKATSSATHDDVIQIKEKIAANRALINRHSKSLYGENHDNGIVVDLRDLKQEQATREKKSWLYFGAFVTVITKAFLDSWSLIKSWLISHS